MRSVDAAGIGARRDPGAITVLDALSYDAANSPKSYRDPVCKREFFAAESVFHAVACRCHLARAIVEFSLLRVCRSYGLLRALSGVHTGRFRGNPEQNSE